MIAVKFFVGIAGFLFLLSCGGASPKDETCDLFKKYKTCVRSASSITELKGCDDSHQSGMRELNSRHEGAAVQNGMGFTYSSAQTSLEDCIIPLEDDQIDEHRKCIWNFLNEVLRGFQCGETDN